MVNQPSTNPNKAFWEAVTLVGILLGVLLLSVLHIKGWLPGTGSVSDALPAPTPAAASAPPTAAPAGPPPATSAPATPATIPPDSSRPPRDEEPRDRGPPGGGGAGTGVPPRRDHDSMTAHLPGGNSATVHFDPRQGPKNVEIGVTHIGPDGRPVRLNIPGSQPGTPQAPYFTNLHSQGLEPEPVTPYVPRMYTQATPGEIRAGVPVSAAPYHSAFPYVPWPTGRDPIGRPVPKPGEQPLTGGHNPRVLEKLRSEETVSPSRVDSGHPAPSPMFANPYWVPSSEVLAPGGTRIPLTPGGVHVKPDYIYPGKVKVPVDVKDPIPAPLSARAGHAAAEAGALRKAAREAEKVKQRQTKVKVDSPEEQKTKKEKVRKEKEKIWVRDPVTGQVKEVEIMSEKTVDVEEEIEPAKAKVKKTKAAVVDEVSPIKEKEKEKEVKRGKEQKGRRLSVEDDAPATVKKKDKAKKGKEEVAASSSEEEVIEDGRKVKKKKKKTNESKGSGDEKAATVKKKDKAKKDKEKVAVSSSEEEVVLDDGKEVKRKKKKKAKVEDGSEEDAKAKDKTKSKKRDKAKVKGEESDSAYDEVSEVDDAGVRRKVKKKTKVKDKGDDASARRRTSLSEDVKVQKKKTRVRDDGQEVEDSDDEAVGPSKAPRKAKTRDVPEDGPAPARAKSNKQKKSDRVEADDADNDYQAVDDLVDPKSNTKLQRRRERMADAPEMAQPLRQNAPLRRPQRQQAQDYETWDEYGDYQRNQLPPLRAQQQQYNNLAPPPPPPIRQPQESRAQYDQRLEEHAQQSMQYQRDLRAAEQEGWDGGYKRNAQSTKGRPRQTANGDGDDRDSEVEEDVFMQTKGKTPKKGDKNPLERKKKDKTKVDDGEKDEDVDEEMTAAASLKSRKSKQKPDGLHLGNSQVETIDQENSGDESTEVSEDGSKRDKESGGTFGLKKRNKRSKVNVEEEQPPTPASAIAAREELARENGGLDTMDDLARNPLEFESEDDTKRTRQQDNRETVRQESVLADAVTSAGPPASQAKAQSKRATLDEVEDEPEESDSDVDEEYEKSRSRRPQRVRNVNKIQTDIKTKRAKEEAEKERLQEKTRENKENEEEQKRLDAQTPGVLSEKAMQKVQDAEDAYLNQDQTPEHPNADEGYDMEAAKRRKAKQAVGTKKTQSLFEEGDQGPNYNALEEAEQKGLDSCAPDVLSEEAKQKVQDAEEQYINQDEKQNHPNPDDKFDMEAARLKKELRAKESVKKEEDLKAKMSPESSAFSEQQSTSKSAADPVGMLQGLETLKKTAQKDTKRHSKFREDLPQAPQPSVQENSEAPPSALGRDTDNTKSLGDGLFTKTDASEALGRERLGKLHKLNREDFKVQMLKDSNTIGSNMAYNKERKGQRANAATWEEQEADKVALPADSDDEFSEDSASNTAYNNVLLPTSEHDDDFVKMETSPKGARALQAQSAIDPNETFKVDSASIQDGIAKSSKPLSRNDPSRQAHRQKVDKLKGGTDAIAEEEKDEVIKAKRPYIEPIGADNVHLASSVDVSPLGDEFKNLPPATQADRDAVSPITPTNTQDQASAAPSQGISQRTKSKKKRSPESDGKTKEQAWTQDDADALTEVDSDGESLAEGSRTKRISKDAPPLPQAMPTWTQEPKTAKAAQLDEIVRNHEPAPITVNQVELDDQGLKMEKGAKDTGDATQKGGEGWDSDSTTVGDEPSSPERKQKSRVEAEKPAELSTASPDQNEDDVSREKREAKERYDAQQEAIKDIARKNKEERLAKEAKKEARKKEKMKPDAKVQATKAYPAPKPKGSQNAEGQEAIGDVDDWEQYAAAKVERDGRQKKTKAIAEELDSSGGNDLVKEIEKERVEREKNEDLKSKEAEKRKSMGIPDTMATGETLAEVKRKDAKSDGGLDGKGDDPGKTETADPKESPNPMSNVFNHKAKNAESKKKLTKEERAERRRERQARKKEKYGDAGDAEGETTDGMTDAERKKQRKREKKERAKKEAEQNQTKEVDGLSGEKTAVPGDKDTAQNEDRGGDKQPSKAQRPREERRKEREQPRAQDEGPEQDPLQADASPPDIPSQGGKDDIQEVGDPDFDSSSTAMDTPGETTNDEARKTARELRKDRLKKKMQEDDEAPRGESLDAGKSSTREKRDRNDSRGQDRDETHSTTYSTSKQSSNGNASNPLGPLAIFRRIAHVLRHAPLYSLLTLATVVLWMEGARQIGNIVILSSTSGQAPTKRAEDPDLEVSTDITNDLLKQKTLDPTAMFVLLNLFMLVGVLLTGIFLSLAVGRANGDPRRTTGEPWYRHPTQPLRRAAKGLLHGVSPLFMGSNVHGPITLFRKSSWKTYLRLFLFALQGVITLLLLRQGLSFMFLVNNSGSAYSDLPDIQKSDGMAEVAKSISPGTALVMLGSIIGVCIFALTVGWYALLNPRSTWSGGGAHFAKFKGNAKILTIFKLVGAGVILITFVALMFFFGEITTYAMGADVPSSTYNINLLAANGILIVFVLPIGWSLLVVWDAIGGLRSKIKQSSLSCV